MNLYSGFFKETISYLTDNGIKSPLLFGGPYPTAYHANILKDRNIDLAVSAEGEITLQEILQNMLSNKLQFPTKN